MSGHVRFPFQLTTIPVDGSAHLMEGSQLHFKPVRLVITVYDAYPSDVHVRSIRFNGVEQLRQHASLTASHFDLLALGAVIFDSVTPGDVLSLDFENMGKNLAQVKAWFVCKLLKSQPTSESPEVGVNMATFKWCGEVDPSVGTHGRDTEALAVVVGVTGSAGDEEVRGDRLLERVTRAEARVKELVFTLHVAQARIVELEASEDRLRTRTLDLEDSRKRWELEAKGAEVHARRANELSDKLGLMESENREIEIENSRLRRRLDALERSVARKGGGR